jgi:predicted acetyltransferase
MTAKVEYDTISNPEEAERLGKILSQCFNGSPDDWPYYFDTIGEKNFRVIRNEQTAVGGLAILEMGQWLGSQRIPMAGIASVGVLPEYRGTGVAIKLLTQMLKELQAKGIPLSTLYAATQRPYRRVGYEQAGTSCQWELSLNEIELGMPQSSIRDIRALPMQPVASLKPEVFQSLYQQRAIANNGNLDRNSTMWKLVLEPPQQTTYGYLIGSQTQPEGYIIFNQTQDYQLAIRDWVVLTPQAGCRLWVFLADHRSILEKVKWYGRANDPLLLLLSEQISSIKSLDRWMLRIVDVPKALEMRGYPTSVEAELHLEIEDDILPENNGKFVLSVSGGRGKVTPGGQGDLQLDIRGLAPLYTGLFTPHQLQLAGQISAKDVSSIDVAAQLFTGSEPWMPDKF